MYVYTDSHEIKALVATEIMKQKNLFKINQLFYA